MKEFPASRTDGFPHGIIAGPDKDGNPNANLWFVVRTSQQIVRMTPEGIMTKFDINGPSASNFVFQPYSIVVGPDGNLWFTEPYANRIVKMTPQGQTQSFTGVGRPYNIIAGRNGDLFFTTLSKKIGRITTYGEVSSIDIPDYPPSGIALDAEGRLWYTTTGGATIVRMNTQDGTTKTFSLPKGSSPMEIIAGPDGNMWFTNATWLDEDRGIGRITPDGTTTLWKTGGGGASIGIGPDGYIWLTNGKSPGALMRFKPGNGPDSGSRQAFSMITARSYFDSVTTGPGPDGKQYLWAVDLPGQVGMAIFCGSADITMPPPLTR